MRGGAWRYVGRSVRHGEAAPRVTPAAPSAFQASKQATNQPHACTCLHNDGIHACSRHLACPLLHQRQLLVKHWREGRWGRSREEGCGGGPGKTRDGFHIVSGSPNQQPAAGSTAGAGKSSVYCKLSHMGSPSTLTTTYPLTPRSCRYDMTSGSCGGGAAAAASQVRPAAALLGCSWR